MRPTALAIAATVALLPVSAVAQPLSCTIPRDVPDATGEGTGIRRVARVTGHTLALSWNPGFCRQSGNRARFQCQSANRFGFVVHGLWPDGAGGRWPQYCGPPRTIPGTIVRQTLCVMPSPRLQWQQYAKHGSCSGMQPAAYFARIHALHAQLRYPDMTALSRRSDLTVARFTAAFARANPGLSPSAIRVAAGRDGWLDEVRICLDTAYRPRACAPTQRGRPGATPLKIWRGR